MRSRLYILLLVLLAVAPIRGQQSKTAFRIAFLTDIHMDLRDTGGRSRGFQKALDHVKAQGVDLMILGGDLADLDRRLPEEYHLADSTLRAVKERAEATGIPTYYTIGNHDRYYYREDGSKDRSGTELYEKVLGRATYSFDHKGVHFVVINSVEPHEGGYRISDEQMEWIRKDLKSMPHGTPLILVTHVPLQSLYHNALRGEISDKDLIENYKPLWDLLTKYHTVAVLQGHNHIHEELFSHGTWLLMGGAVSGAWWQGPLDQTEEGYLLLTLDPEQDRYSWEYIDIEWEAE